MTGRSAHFGAGVRTGTVRLEEFGVSVVSGYEETHLRKFHEETKHPTTVTRTPISSIRGGQHHVDYDPAFRRDPEMDKLQPVRGVTLPDGKTQLRDGHHRLVSALSRGETHLDVEHLGYGYGRCLLPHCEYDHPVAPPRR